MKIYLLLMTELDLDITCQSGNLNFVFLTLRYTNGLDTTCHCVRLMTSLILNFLEARKTIRVLFEEKDGVG